jgi:hypothetical protein
MVQPKRTNLTRQVKEDLLFFGFEKPVKRLAEVVFVSPSDKSDGSIVSKPEGFRVSKVVDLSR